MSGGLKIFVPVKRVVDYAVKIRIRPDKMGAWRGEAAAGARTRGTPGR